MSDKWVYEDLDFDNRVSNMMWTISGRYDENMDVGEKSFISRNVALYHGITAGGRRKYIDWGMVKKFVISRARAGFHKDTLLALIQFVSDAYVEKKLIDERPGIVDIRRTAYDDMVSHFFKLHTDDLIEKVRHTLVLEKAGRNPRIDVATSKLTAAIHEAENAEDTRDMLREVERIYLAFFPLYVVSEDGEVISEEKRQYGEQSDFADFMEEEYYDDYEEAEALDERLDEIAEALLGDTLEGEAFAGDAANNRVLRVKDEDLEEIYRQVAFHYGESYLTQAELKRLSARVCRGVHENCRIHLTDGVIRGSVHKSMEKNLVSRHKTRNEIAFGENRRVYRRNINKLRDSIARTLIQEEFKDQIASDAGLLVANKLWRVGRSSNTKVFVRTMDNTKGSYVVDILIDSSGSQRRKQASVAIQAYILAQALTLNGIPNRVNGFNTFLDYTILKRFRDYESPLSANENIFEYVCSGNNRDGLAIKTVVEGLKERPEDNKILIVLSDGRPSDIKIGKGQVQTMEEAYRGAAGVRDTAIEVRRARQAGLMVLGVFTGREADLGAEKLIYGKDFAYTKDISRFADIVIKYLKQIISN